jgi:hypothetical protein
VRNRYFQIVTSGVTFLVKICRGAVILVLDAIGGCEALETNLAQFEASLKNLSDTNSSAMIECQTFYHPLEAALQLLELAGQAQLTTSENRLCGLISLCFENRSAEIEQVFADKRIKLNFEEAKLCSQLWRQETSSKTRTLQTSFPQKMPSGQLTSSSDLDKSVQKASAFFLEHRIVSQLLKPTQNIAQCSYEFEQKIQTEVLNCAQIISTNDYENPFCGCFCPSWINSPLQDRLPVIWLQTSDELDAVNSAEMTELVHEWAHLSLAWAASTMGVYEWAIPSHQREAFALYAECLWESQNEQSWSEFFSNFVGQVPFLKKAKPEHIAGYGSLLRWQKKKPQQQLIDLEAIRLAWNNFNDSGV